MTLKLNCANMMTIEACLKYTDKVVFKNAEAHAKWQSLSKEDKAKILKNQELFNQTLAELTNSSTRYGKGLDEFARSKPHLVLVQEFNHVLEEQIKKDGRFSVLVKGFNGWVDGKIPTKDYNELEDMGCAILVPTGGDLSGWDVLECGEIHKPIFKIKDGVKTETDRAMVFAVVSDGKRTIIVGTWHLVGYFRGESDFEKTKDAAQFGYDELNNWTASLAELKVKYPGAEVVVGGDFNESDVPAPGVKYTADEFKTISRIAKLQSLGFQVTSTIDGPTEILRDGGKRGGQNIDWVASTIPVTVTGTNFHKVAENEQGVCDDFNLISDHRFLEVLV